MMKFILGIVVGIALIVGGALIYFTSGMAPAATADPPMPFEKLIARYALKARISKEAPATIPINADEAAFLSGARAYRMDCAMCHGLPMQPAPIVAKGMFPKPPQLFQTQGSVAGDPPGSIFWKVKNGIRLTGMPSFSPALTDQQIWQVTLLLANSDKLPSSVQQALVSSQAAASPTK